MPRNLRKADHVERASAATRRRGAQMRIQVSALEKNQAGPDRTDRSPACSHRRKRGREGTRRAGGTKRGRGKGGHATDSGRGKGRRASGCRGGLVRPSYCCGSARTAIRGASARSASTKPACGHSHRFGGLSRRLHYLVSVGSGNECESATGEKVRDHDQDRRSAWCPPACHDLKISCRDKLEIREER